MNRLILFSLLIGSHWAIGQESLSWKMLLETQYKIISEGNDKGLFEPQFTNELKKLEEKEVMISGYLIPMDLKNDSYALSMSPFSSCFFCGNAGPNTVIELQFSEKQNKFMVDQFIIVKGVLSLNRFNPKKLFFILENAQIHG